MAAVRFGAHEYDAKPYSSKISRRLMQIFRDKVAASTDRDFVESTKREIYKSFGRDPADLQYKDLRDIYLVPAIDKLIHAHLVLDLKKQKKTKDHIELPESMGTIFCYFMMDYCAVRVLSQSKNKVQRGMIARMLFNSTAPEVKLYNRGYLMPREFDKLAALDSIFNQIDVGFGVFEGRERCDHLMRAIYRYFDSLAIHNEPSAVIAPTLYGLMTSTDKTPHIAAMDAYFASTRVSKFPDVTFLLVHLNQKYETMESTKMPDYVLASTSTLLLDVVPNGSSVCVVRIQKGTPYVPVPNFTRLRNLKQLLLPRNHYLTIRANAHGCGSVIERNIKILFAEFTKVPIA